MTITHACHLLAERIADELETQDVWLREMDIEEDKYFRKDLFSIIRSHTIISEMIKFLLSIAKLKEQPLNTLKYRAEAKKILEYMEK